VLLSPVPILNKEPSVVLKYKNVPSVVAQCVASKEMLYNEDKGPNTTQKTLMHLRDHSNGLTRERERKNSCN
jgi:hypothetical protein